MRWAVELLAVLALVLAGPAQAADVTQEDIEALERDLNRTQDPARRADLLGMLMEGLVERCFPSDSRLANPVVRDDWSRGCLTRAVEVAEEIESDPAHRDRARALFVAGKASLALSRPSAGEALLTRFLDEYPGEPEAPLAHYSLAERAYAAKEFDAAAEHYRGAAGALTGAEAAMPRYRLAWCLQKTGHAADGARALAALIAEEGGLDDAQRLTAVADLEAMTTEVADPDTTFHCARAALGDAAPGLAAKVAGALMAGGRYAEASAHFAALVDEYGGHDDAWTWQVGRVDAAFESSDWPGAVTAASGLMRDFGPGTALVEEAARGAVGRLHERHRDHGDLAGESVEALYDLYQETFPTAAKAPQMRLALAALYQEEGRGLEALETFVAVADDQAGRELGASAARLAADQIRQGVDAGGSDVGASDVGAYQQALIRLADLFADRYARHSDGLLYAREAGRVLASQGEADEATDLLVAAALRLPAVAEASACAALAVELQIEAERWDRALEVIEQLLAERRLISAHPALADVLRKSRAAASFNRATAIWEAGDPGTAAPLFDAVATDDTGGDLAPKALYNAAICHDESGNGSRAAMTLRRLYTGHPDHALAPTALEQAAFLRYDKGEYTGAAELYLLLTDTYPDHENAAFSLYTAAALFDQEGVFDRAMDAYGRLLARYPDAPECVDAAPRLEELKAGE